MDSRVSVDEEVFTRCKEREACIHSEKDTIMDERIVQISPLTFEIYHTKKCKFGCYYEVFVRKHVISEEAIRSMINNSS